MRVASSAFSNPLLLVLVLVFFLPLNTALASPGEADLTAVLTLDAAIDIARAQRTEITAAQARAVAANERVAVVSALEDPMVMPAIDHYPWRDMDSMERPTGRFDWNVTVEQRFPLSRVRSHRRQGAEAETQRLLAESDRVILDVEQQAAEAFYMLSETRRMLTLVAQQIVLAEQMVQAASARMSVGNGSQIDVLRAEVEVARLQGKLRSLTAEERGGQAMFNATIGRSADVAVPPLALSIDDSAPLAGSSVFAEALAYRPELKAGVAEIARADAEIDVMRSMYRPMGFVRVGPASSMSQGRGGMLMFGVSVPIWRNKLAAGVAEATAMAQMAQADYLAMQRMVEGDVINAREQVAAAREALLALRDEIVPRARLAQEPALAGYAAGIYTLVTVIDAAQAQWFAETELVMAETNLGLARVKLERAIGHIEARQQ